MGKTFAAAILTAAARGIYYTIPATNPDLVASPGTTANASGSNCSMVVMTTEGSTSAQSKIKVKQTINSSSGFSALNQYSSGVCVKNVTDAKYVCMTYLMSNSSSTPQLTKKVQANATLATAIGMASPSCTDEFTSTSNYATTNANMTTGTAATACGATLVADKWIKTTDASYSANQVNTEDTLLFTSKTLAELETFLKTSGTFYAGCKVGGTGAAITAETSGSTQGIKRVDLTTDEVLPTITVPNTPAPFAVPTTNTSLNPTGTTKKCSFSAWVTNGTNASTQSNVFIRTTVDFGAALSTTNQGQFAACWKNFTTSTTWDCLTFTVRADYDNSSQARLYWEERSKTSDTNGQGALVNLYTCQHTIAFGAFSNLAVADGTIAGCGASPLWAVSATKIGSYSFNIDAKLTDFAVTPTIANSRFSTTGGNSFVCKWDTTAFNTSSDLKLANMVDVVPSSSGSSGSSEFSLFMPAVIGPFGRNPNAKDFTCSLKILTQQGADASKANFKIEWTLTQIEVSAINNTMGTIMCWEDFTSVESTTLQANTWHCLSFAYTEGPYNSLLSAIWKSLSDTTGVDAMRSLQCYASESFPAAWNNYAPSPRGFIYQLDCTTNWFNYSGSLTAVNVFKIVAQSPDYATTQSNMNKRLGDQSIRRTSFGCMYDNPGGTGGLDPSPQFLTAPRLVTLPTSINRFSVPKDAAWRPSSGGLTCQMQLWVVPGSTASKSKFYLNWTVESENVFSETNVAGTTMCWEDFSNYLLWNCIAFQLKGATPAFHWITYQKTDTNGGTAIASTPACSTSTPWGTGWSTLLQGSRAAGTGNGCNTAAINFVWVDNIDLTTKKKLTVEASSPEYDFTEDNLSKKLSAANKTAFACKSAVSDANLAWVASDVKVFSLIDDQVNLAPTLAPRFTIANTNTLLKPVSGVTCDVKLWIEAGSVVTASKFTTEWTFDFTSAISATNLASGAMCWENFSNGVQWDCIGFQMTGDSTNAKFVYSYSSAPDSNSGKFAILSSNANCSTETPYGAYATATRGYRANPNPSTSCRLFTWTDTLDADRNQLKVVVKTTEFLGLDTTQMAYKFRTPNKTSFACKSSATTAGTAFVAEDVKIVAMSESQFNLAPTTVPRFTIAKTNSILKPASGVTCEVKLWNEEGSVSTASKFITEWTLDFQTAISATNLASGAMCWEDFATAANTFIATWNCVGFQMTGDVSGAKIIFSSYSGPDALLGQQTIFSTNAKCIAETPYGAFATATQGYRFYSSTSTNCSYTWTDSLNQAKTRLTVAISSPEYAALTKDAMATKLTTPNKTSFVCKSAATTAATAFVNTDVKVMKMDDNQSIAAPATTAAFFVNKDSVWKPSTGNQSCELKVWAMEGADATKSKFTTQWTIDFSQAVDNNNLGASAMCWQDFIASTYWSCFSLELTTFSGNPSFIFSTYRAEDTDGKKAILDANKKCATRTPYGTSWSSATKSARAPETGTDCGANNFSWTDTFAAPYRYLSVVVTSPDYPLTQAALTAKLLTNKTTSFVCKFAVHATFAVITAEDVKLMNLQSSSTTPATSPPPTASAVSIVGSALSAAAILAYACF